VGSRVRVGARWSGVLAGLIACANGATPQATLHSAAVDSARAGGTVLHRSSDDIAAQIEAALSARGSRGLTATESGDLRALYQRNQNAALWSDSSGRPGAEARDGLSLLDAAGVEGLDPGDYGVAELASLREALERRPTPHNIARFDVAMSAGMLRYLRDLHMGRVDPRSSGFRLRAPDHQDDFAEILRAAVAGRRLREAVAELPPPLVQYQLLRAMLARYRSLASDTALETLPITARAVRPGDSYEGAAALGRRLVALGDLPPDAALPERNAYDGALVDGVRRFQARHGLDADGIVGRQTQAALQVPLAWRVRQIELALERLRWLPDMSGGPFVTVNIPMFELRAWDAIGPTSRPRFGMGVIVGRALSTETPVFAAEMRSVIFRPYWNVPQSILLHETLPAVRRDPGYLRRNDMEIVSGSRVVAATPGNLELLRRGELLLRQRPGPSNALGLIKFDFPNAHDIYMHDTPAAALFSRSRRDFSHGCVRVEDPVRLAEWVLTDDPAWTRDEILAAMNGSRTFEVKLPQPVQVLMFYLTAMVRPEDASIRFAEDIYGHDARLDRALAGR
jgi:murein L,D-transpeptidase YcbB/YkuD